MSEQRPLDINNERSVRLNKIADLENQDIACFPAQIPDGRISVSEALGSLDGAQVNIAGRLMTKREMGKLTFCHLQDETGKMQVALKSDEIAIEQYKTFTKLVDSGDIVSVTGERFTTHKGEPSILIKKWTLLAKAVLPLPDKFHGLQDEEVRYRKRYLDFLTNPEQKEKILVRSRMLRYFREFLNTKGFIEVETPILESVASGAMAESFDTHLNAYDLSVHLRICIGELWQKRLMVGGFEKTYEIGRAFRNEGVDHQHNPEFTMIEYYWAYADYEDNMRLHEELIPYLVEKSVGKLVIESEGHTIDFTAPYPRVTFHDAVLEHAGIDINKYMDAESLTAIMKQKGYEVDENAGRGKLLDSLYKQSARPKIIQPTFVLEYPVELKPLAKKAKDPRYTEMFQLIVRGFELSNSYTELNDPIDQRNRFEEQARLAAAGDEEAMAYDRDYVEALEHGMPPTTGTGIGIDRFVALITGSHTLRETMAFPMMKPVEVEENEVGKSKKTLVAHAVLLNSSAIPNWSKLNAAAHLSAALAAREGRKLLHIESTMTTDGEKIPMNIQHAIMMKETGNREDLLQLKRNADTQGLVATCFTEEMRDSSNDEKVKAKQEVKVASEIGFLGVLVYGEKKQVEKLTEKFNLIS